MLKKLLLAAAFVLPTLAFGQTYKIAIVDVDEIVQALPDFTDAQNKLADTSKKYEDEYAKLNEEMKRRYDEIQNMSQDELPAIRDRKIQDFQEYQQKIAQFEQTATQELGNYQQQLMAPIYQKVNNAVQSVGQEGSYSLVQLKNPQIILYYADPVVDITPEVKAKLGL